MGLFGSKNSNSSDDVYEEKYRQWERASVQARQAETRANGAPLHTTAAKEAKEARAQAEQARQDLKATASRLWPKGRTS
jgi:regulator of protease activity HflC (stomatin/prohibitin superfamily)